MLNSLFPRMFEGIYITVGVDEDLEILSKRFEVKVEDIILLNNIQYPYKINEGDILFIIKNDNYQNINNFGEVNKFDTLEDEVIIYENKNNYNISKKYPTIKKGDTGKYVNILKMFISALGCQIKSTDISFNRELETHILAIQKEAGFAQDGVVDKKVWDYIFDKINNNV